MKILNPYNIMNKDVTCRKDQGVMNFFFHYHVFCNPFTLQMFFILNCYESFNIFQCS
jgi:hypothetical protein